MTPQSTLPDLITDAQAVEERFLRQIFVRDQMAEWSKQPLVMSRADGVHYWDVHGKRYLDALSGIYVASVGPHNRRPPPPAAPAPPPETPGAAGARAARRVVWVSGRPRPAPPAGGGGGGGGRVAAAVVV